MTDRFVVRVVVVALAAVVLVALGLAGYLTAVDRTVPDFVVASGSGALGALSAVLVRTSSEPPA